MPSVGSASFRRVLAVRRHELTDSLPFSQHAAPGTGSVAQIAFCQASGAGSEASPLILAAVGGGVCRALRGGDCNVRLQPSTLARREAQQFVCFAEGEGEGVGAGTWRTHISISEKMFTSIPLSYCGCCAPHSDFKTFHGMPSQSLSRLVFSIYVPDENRT